MKKRIMHILNSSEYSGAENVVITIINYMKVYFDLCYVSRDGSIRERLEKEKIEFIPIIDMSVSEIRRVVKLKNPDLIQAHDFTASIICSISFARVPLFSHLHNNNPWIRTFHIYSFLYLFSSFKYKKIFMVSEAVFNEYVFKKNIRKKSVIIGNPISIKEIQEKSKSGENDKEYDALFLGRLSLQKNPLRFIRIIKGITNQGQTIRSAMIGQGELEDDCYNEIKDLKLDGSIEMLGFLENPFLVLKKSRILCITSDWEGYGLVAVEALANGIPVLSMPVGGLVNIIDNECGKICKDETEFVTEILCLMTDSEYYLSKKNKALKKANSLNNIDKYMLQLLKYYQKTMIER